MPCFYLSSASIAPPAPSTGPGPSLFSPLQGHSHKALLTVSEHFLQVQARFWVPALLTPWLDAQDSLCCSLALCFSLALLESFFQNLTLQEGFLCWLWVFPLLYQWDHRQLSCHNLYSGRISFFFLSWSIWTAKRSNQIILKEINPKYSLEGLMLKVKLQYFGHLIRRTDLLGKTLMLGKTEGRKRRGHRGWDGWIASPTWWTWVWVSSRSWWCLVKPGVLQSMGLQRVGHDWMTELNW